MRVLRTSMALVAVAGLSSGAARAQMTAQTILADRAPNLRGVDYDLPLASVRGADPATKAAVDACKLEANSRGYTVRDGQGKILRKFLDTNAKLVQRKGEEKPGKHMDQWSYYLDGFEVYRESDLDEDGFLDEVRWMNAGGTRIAQVRPSEKGGGTRVVAWTRLSAEEASKVLVQALVLGDVALLETVLATPEELATINAPQATLDRVAASQAARAEAVQKLQSAIKRTGWTAQTAWSRFDGAMPRVIPSDAAPGLKGEVLLYENVVIFADAGNPADNARIAYLSAPEVVKIGDSWKFVDLPHAVDPAKPVGGAVVSLRGDIFSQVGDDGPKPPPEQVAALKKLNDFDSAGVPDGSDKRKLAEWNLNRAKVLREVIAAAPDAAQKLQYQKQAINNIADATRTGMYPDGMAVLDKFIADGGKIGSFAAQRKILVQFDLDIDEPGSNYLKAQEACLAKFEAFLKDFPNADEEPEVLYQLASVNEFNGSEDAAKAWYARLAKGHPASESGKKAIGALRRLDSDGKVVKVAGPGLHGKAASSEDYRGKPLLLVYWSSTSEADQKDLKELAALREKLGPKGFEVLGISLDDDRAALEAFLKANPLPWYTLHEPGGMDSRLANDLGIISTPTMILLDAKGQVANRKIRKANEVEKALDKTLAGRGVGMNSGVR